MRYKLLMVVLVLAVGLFVGCSAQEPADTQEATTPQDTDMDSEGIETMPDDTQQENPAENDMQEPDVVLEFTGENYVYYVDGEENPTITVQEGDLVRVEYETISGLHDWVIDEFASTQQVSAQDGVTTVEFVADQTGTFEYYCSVGNHRQQGMFGEFIVE